MCHVACCCFGLYTLLHAQDLGTVLQNTHDFWIVLVLAAPEKCGERCAAAAESFEKVASKSSDVFHFGTMDVFDMLPGNLWIVVCGMGCTAAAAFEWKP